jgi:hypothetical protein
VAGYPHAHAAAVATAPMVALYGDEELPRRGAQGAARHGEGGTVVSLGGGRPKARKHGGGSELGRQSWRRHAEAALRWPMAWASVHVRWRMMR